MAWPFQQPDPTPVLTGERVLLRAPRPADHEAWRSLRHASRAFLRPFEPRWTDADLGRSVFLARTRRAREEAVAGTDFSFLIFSGRDPYTLVGGLTLSNIRRRAAQFGTIGYWMGESFAGQGYMTEAVATVLPFVFGALQLHRVHAACLPHNMASRRVLEKNGFREEGFAEGYLQIDGRWADHALYGLVREHYDTLRRLRAGQRG